MKRAPPKKSEAARTGKLANPKPIALKLRAPINVRSFSLVLLTVLAVIFTLHWAKEVFIPLMLGVMISYALSPPVSFLEKWHIPRALGAAVLLLGIVGGTGYAVYSLSDDAARLIETLPGAAQKFRKTLNAEQGQSEGKIEKVQKAATQLESAARETGAPPPAAPSGVTRVQIEKPKINVKDYLWLGTLGAFAMAAQAGIVLFLSYFLLVSGNMFRRKLVIITGPTLSNKKITLQVLDDINGQIQRYLLVLVSTSILVGIVSWLAFTWVGLEQIGRASCRERVCT